MLEPIDAATERVAAAIVDAAYHVHRALGPGLLESVYETCLAHELSKRGIDVQRQVVLPIVYDGVTLESGLRLDMVVGGCVVVELKAVEVLLPVHKAQVLAYLRLSGHRLGILLNFNVALIKEGIRRIVF
ncbi:MAG: GxxExxY protein [Chloroflexi bacterium]|nr:GxxExxY protein [Chloroflexota bacterium]